MKAIILEQHVKRSYYLACRGFSKRGYPFSLFSIDYDDPREEIGFVRHEDEHLLWNPIFETSDYTREFASGELLNVDGDNYTIILVSHDKDGTVIYRIGKNVIVEDLESKNKAHSDLTLRRELLEVRKSKEYIDAEVKKEEVIIKEESKSRKWYEFWK